MNRPIKFRAKEVLKGKWVYGDYFSKYEDGETKHYIVEHPYGRRAGRELMWVVDPDTVSEFIGLKDHDDREIYRGDTLRLTEGERSEIATVVYGPNGAYELDRAVSLYTVGGHDLQRFFFVGSRDSFTVTIVGNVFENKEQEETGNNV